MPEINFMRVEEGLRYTVGNVLLLKLTQPNTGVVLYAAEYPHKVGGEDLCTTVMAQFLKLEEAEQMVRMYADREA